MIALFCLPYDIVSWVCLDLISVSDPETTDAIFCTACEPKKIRRAESGIEGS